MPIVAVRVAGRYRACRRAAHVHPPRLMAISTSTTRGGWRDRASLRRSGRVRPSGCPALRHARLDRRDRKVSGESGRKRKPHAPNRTEVDPSRGNPAAHAATARRDCHPCRGLDAPSAADHVDRRREGGRAVYPVPATRDTKLCPRGTASCSAPDRHEEEGLSPARTSAAGGHGRSARLIRHDDAARRWAAWQGGSPRHRGMRADRARQERDRCRNGLPAPSPHPPVPVAFRSAATAMTRRSAASSSPWASGLRSKAAPGPGVRPGGSSP